jgi:hypothetical protein
MMISPFVSLATLETEKIGKFVGPSEDMQNDSNDRMKVDFGAIDRTPREQKAEKADDAEVPKYLWMEHLIDDGPTTWSETRRAMLPVVMDTCQKYLLRKWKIRLVAEFHRWFESVYHFRTTKEETIVWKDGSYQWSNGGRMKYKLHCMRVAVDAGQDWEAEKDAVIRAQRANWWEWDNGSRCFDWRWPGRYMNTIRNGLEVHFPGEKPRFRSAQRDIRGAAAKVKVTEKLEKMRKRRYIVEGLMESLTSVFAVDKVDDIR